MDSSSTPSFGAPSAWMVRFQAPSSCRPQIQYPARQFEIVRSNGVTRFISSPSVMRSSFPFCIVADRIVRSGEMDMEEKTSPPISWLNVNSRFRSPCA
jgi:hypothetical protein